MHTHKRTFWVIFEVVNEANHLIGLRDGRISPKQIEKDVLEKAKEMFLNHHEQIAYLRNKSYRPFLELWAGYNNLPTKERRVCELGNRAIHGLFCHKIEVSDEYIYCHYSQLIRHDLDTWDKESREMKETILVCKPCESL